MKRPSFQFYPGDWQKDAALRMCSVGARGLWIDMLCIMHQGSPYGYLKVNDKVVNVDNLSRMVGATTQEVAGWLQELEASSVFRRADDGCIYSKRMVEDEKLRVIRAAGGVLGGNPKLKNKPINNKKEVNHKANLSSTPSSSSASSSSFKKPLVGKPTDPEFEKAWAQYPKRSGNNPKKDALKAWSARISEGVTAQELCDGLARYAKWCEATDKTGTETVMQAVRFFGPSRLFEQSFDLPRPTTSNGDHSWKRDDGLIMAKATELKISISGLFRADAISKIEQAMERTR